MASASEGRHRAPDPVRADAVDEIDLDTCPADGSVALNGRVELLVAALLSVSADLDLRGVLRRTLEAACVLTGAAHGMIAVTGDRAILYGEQPPGRSLGTSTAGMSALVRVGEQPYARIRLTPPADGSGFDAGDELMLAQLTGAAGQAIGNALEHRRARRIADAADEAVTVERDRVARDLHDTVIQRLFATGMQLQGLRRTAGEEAGPGITGVVRDLDATMKDLRAAIYGLRRPRRVTVLGQVESLVEEYAAGLGFRPELRHSGPVDALLDGDLGDHVLATLREALSNIVKHARATAAEIELHVSPSWTMLRVGDDGVGIPSGERGVLGSGLANLRVRAERLGGVLRIEGGRLDWIVPTSH